MTVPPQYDLPKTMAFHKQKSVDMCVSLYLPQARPIAHAICLCSEVDMWRFEKVAK